MWQLVRVCMSQCVYVYMCVCLYVSACVYVSMCLCVVGKSCDSRLALDGCNSFLRKGKVALFPSSRLLNMFTLLGALER